MLRELRIGKFYDENYILNNNVFIAYRLIKSKKHNFFSFTTVIAIAGIAVSVAILILSLQILDGFENTIFSSAARIDAQIKITAFGKQNLKPDAKTEQNIKRKLGNLFAACEPFISKYTVVKSRKNSDGAIITGIKGETTFENLKKFIVDGTVKLSGEKIVLGKLLAEKLSVKCGDKITVIALKNDKIPDAENPPNIMRFAVSGIFEIGMPYYDDSFAFVSFENARTLFGSGNKISGYNIFLKTQERAKIENAVASLKEILPYPYYVRSIFAVHRNIFVWLELQKKPIPVVLSAITLVAMLNIIGALFLLVLKRFKTIGILRVLGYSKKQIRIIFLLQGGFISLSGIAIGVLSALALTAAQNSCQIVSLPGNIYFMDTLKIGTDLFYYLLIALGAQVVGIATSLIPSKFAADISPVNAIRNN